VKRSLIVAVLALLLPAWAHAVYVVILKNGGRVVAREKYEVKGQTVIITTKLGTLTSIPLSQVDLEATWLFNARRIGDATPLDWLDENKPTPVPTPTVTVTTLGKIRRGIAAPENDAARPTPTPGIAFRDATYRDPKVQRAFEEGLEAYHIYLYRTGTGTQSTYLFLEVQVNGQREVTKALEAVTTTYHLLAEKAPERAPEKVEIQMLNESGKEAGLFRVSAEDATRLATGKVTAEDFFLQQVIF